MDIPIPQPTTPDIYSLGFNKGLERTTESQESSTVYNAVQNAVNAAQMSGTLGAEAGGTGQSENIFRRVHISTCFESLDRLIVAAPTGSGLISTGYYGLFAGTGITASSCAEIHLPIFSSTGFFRDGMVFSAFINHLVLDAANGAGSFFIGVPGCNVTGAGHDFTQEHIGFKIIKSSGVVGLYATQNNSHSGLSQFLTTISDNDAVSVVFRVSGKRDCVEYYYRIRRWTPAEDNGWIGPVRLVQDIKPNGQFLGVSISNDGTDKDMQLRTQCVSIDF